MMGRMSTDTSTRSPEAALEQAREAVGTGPIPARTALRKLLGVGWGTAAQIHAELTSERQQERTERRGRMRATMARIQARGVSRMARRTPPRSRPKSELAEPQAPTVVAASAPDPGVTETAHKIDTGAPPRTAPKQIRTWPIAGLILPAFVAIWAGWVDLGRLTGFGVVRPFPGIPGADRIQINTAITLPIGLETYAAFALYVWLSGLVRDRALTFARGSAIGSLVLGAAGQVAYHLMVAAGWASAPWWITTIVSCIPVAVLGMGAALAHLVRSQPPVA
jgi:hypothetical protein